MASVFVVAATVLAIVSGQPIHPFGPDEDTRYDVWHKFPSMAACQQYHHSEHFKEAHDILEASVVAALGNADAKVTIVEECHEFIPGPDGQMIDKTALEGSS